MKILRHIAVVLLVLLPLGAGAQSNHVRKAMEKAKQKQEEMARAQVSRESNRPVSGGNMRMIVENGDTTFLDRLPAVYILGRGKHTSEKAWREYYKLVWRFARVYPYAQAAGVLVKQVDSTLNAEHYGFIRKDRYISAIQKELFRDFEGAFREMTISQGTVMIKLISRETGFWQGVAKLFDNDLKSNYDPQGADKELEELVQAWHRDEFRDLYWSVFWEDPPVITLPAKYRVK